MQYCLRLAKGRTSIWGILSIYYSNCLTSMFQPAYGAHLMNSPVRQKPRAWKEIKKADMKVVNSLKTLKSRDRNCRVIRRRGRVYVINKINKRFKARQG